MQPGPFGYVPSTKTEGRDLCMKGRVRTNERCPFGCKYDGVTLECATHRTRPKRYYIDTSGFRLATRKLYKDREGRILSSRDLADRMLTSMRVAFDSRAGFNPADWEPSKLREFKFASEWGKWIESKERGWSSRYLKNVRWLFNKILSPRWADMDVRDLRSAHLIDLKTQLEKAGYAPTTIKLALSISISFLNEMNRRGDIEKTPIRPTVEIPGRDLWILAREQQNEIVPFTPKHYHTIYRLLIATGVRESEVCALLVRDVVSGFLFFCRSIDDEGNLTNHTKTKKVHRKPIPADMHDEIMEAMKDKTPAAYLFTNKKGTPFRPGYLSRNWIVAARKCGYEVPLGMSTRHAFANATWREEEAEAKERTARKLGDTVRVTFENYIHER